MLGVWRFLMFGELINVRRTDQLNMIAVRNLEEQGFTCRTEQESCPYLAEEKLFTLPASFLHALIILASPELP